MAEMAALPSTSQFASNLITAEIRVENIDTSATASISIPSISQQQQQQQQQSSVVESSANIEADNNNKPSHSMKENDEPEAKRQKLDKSVKSKKFEKLESRLNSVLCCSVCLDLPSYNMAMYQVRKIFPYTFYL
jgi:hypothetical protein